MVPHIRTIGLCTLLAVSTAFSLPREKRRAFPAVFKNASSTMEAPLSAPRLAKSAAFVWKKTGTTLFDNTGTDKNPVWDLSSRDTTIYDPAGNIVLEMSSIAERGWNRDSLSSIDSTVYVNGKAVENVYREFYRDDPGTISVYGYRTVTTYLNNDKTLLSIAYDWDDSLKNWTLSSKDSAVFSASGAGNYDYADLTTLTGSFSWRYDTKTKGWISTEFLLKTDGECTATRLVLTGKSTMEETGDVLVDAKNTHVFSSSKWTENNWLEELAMRRYKPSGPFVNYYRYVREVNAGGWQTRSDGYDWDTTASVWVDFYNEINFPDAYGNDTLYYWASFDSAASGWDSGSVSHLRTYDAYGNNTGVLSYYWSEEDGTWLLGEKTINTFAQINQSVKFTVKPAGKQTITVRVSPASVTFAGPNIEGLDLYNAAGRPVLSVRQKPEATLQIYPAQSMVPTGVYIARIRTSSGKTSLRLPLCR